jgi:hypothetical protein
VSVGLVSVGVVSAAAAASWVVPVWAAAVWAASAGAVFVRVVVRVRVRRRVGVVDSELVADWVIVCSFGSDVVLFDNGCPSIGSAPRWVWPGRSDVSEVGHAADPLFASRGPLTTSGLTIVGCDPAAGHRRRGPHAGRVRQVAPPATRSILRDGHAGRADAPAAGPGATIRRGGLGRVSSGRSPPAAGRCGRSRRRRSSPPAR